MPVDALPRLVVRPIPSSPTAADLAVLSDDERARADAMRLPSARVRFVTRRALLRRELAAHLNAAGRDIAGRDVEFWCEPCSGCGAAHGRPRATVWEGYFSVSSTASAVAVALHSRQIGVDVEDLVSRETALDVAGTLHPRERHAVDAAFAASEHEGRELFTRLWTRKEALLKATGEGLTAPLDRDDTSDPTPREGSPWIVTDVPATHLPPGTYGALAVLADGQPPPARTTRSEVAQDE